MAPMTPYSERVEKTIGTKSKIKGDKWQERGDAKSDALSDWLYEALVAKGFETVSVTVDGVKYKWWVKS